MDFTGYVFAEDSGVAQKQVGRLRALCVALGFDPGAARVVKCSAAELDRTPRLAEELANARVKLRATPGARKRAIEAVASHVEGDLTVASAMVESIEASDGEPLKATVARTLISAQRQDRRAAA